MSFRNSLVFPFPTVQYIPLPITELQKGPIPLPHSQNNAPQLIAGNDLIAWESSLERDYGLKIPDMAGNGLIDSCGINPNLSLTLDAGSNADAACPFLAINLKITIAKYRGFFITMLGDYTPGQYQLGAIPTRRLYKSNLIIDLFDQASGKRLVHQSLFWPPNPASSRTAKTW
jgi:hypothetical protein